jgi:bifunctional DNA-binding transcriptional regulator/antitoxin component of YhaV-PrlF toxin-antitoxin module
VPTNYVMKVSANGQVSIPAATRSRWMAERVVVVDLGDRIVMRPLPDDPVAELTGKYRMRGSTSEAARAAERSDAAQREARKPR